jgi:hypothetical protein
MVRRRARNEHNPARIRDAAQLPLAHAQRLAQTYRATGENGVRSGILPGKTREGRARRRPRSERAKARHALRNSALRHQTILGPGRALIENVIAQRVEHRLAVDALGALHHVGMMPDHDVRALLDQPLCGAALSGARRRRILLAPVHENHDQVREPARQTQLLAQLQGRYADERSCAPGNLVQGHKRHAQPAEVGQVRRGLERQRHDAGLAQHTLRLVEARGAEIARMIVGEAQRMKPRASQKIHIGGRRREAKPPRSLASPRVAESTLQVSRYEIRPAEHSVPRVPRRATRALDLGADASIEQNIPGKQQANLAGRCCERHEDDQKGSRGGHDSAVAAR